MPHPARKAARRESGQTGLPFFAWKAVCAFVELFKMENKNSGP
ncbi:MAG TPA: hypothetical protein VNU49_06020 [Opitutaceae bacterium]|nr:hypothetical protein [Opitutaceae bacterium]